jgi:crossover junction endodeoxyribonuclease RuvC
MRILGIDPGSRNCGLAIVDTHPLAVVHLETSVLPGLGGQALHTWHGILEHWITTWEPDEIAMESIYFGANVSSAVKVGEARGIVMLAGYAHNLPVASYTPQQAKKALTGHGRAKKLDIIAALQAAQLTAVSSEHANDAAALAICHAVLTETIVPLPGIAVLPSIAVEAEKAALKAQKAIAKAAISQ